MIQMKVETAIKDRVSKTGWNQKRKKIKAGETCLVFTDYQGWKTNVKQSDAKKMLKKCLTQLESEGYKTPMQKTVKEKLIKQNETKGFKTMNFLPEPKTFSIEVGTKTQIGVGVVAIAGLFWGFKKLKRKFQPKIDAILSNGQSVHERSLNNGATETKDSKKEKSQSIN